MHLLPPCTLLLNVSYQNATVPGTLGMHDAELFNGKPQAQLLQPAAWFRAHGQISSSLARISASGFTAVTTAIPVGCKDGVSLSLLDVSRSLGTSRSSFAFTPSLYCRSCTHGKLMFPKGAACSHWHRNEHYTQVPSRNLNPFATQVGFRFLEGSHFWRVHHFYLKMQSHRKQWISLIFLWSCGAYVPSKQYTGHTGGAEE